MIKELKVQLRAFQFRFILLKPSFIETALFWTHCSTSGRKWTDRGKQAESENVELRAGEEKRSDSSGTVVLLRDSGHVKTNFTGALGWISVIMPQSNKGKHRSMKPANVLCRNATEKQKGGLELTHSAASMNLWSEIKRVNTAYMEAEN